MRLKLNKNIEMLEILSTNRGLEKLVHKGVKMLSQIKLEDIPSFKEGMEKGLQKGMQKGMQKGIQEGIKKGKILMLRELGFSDEEISKRLNLSIKEINEILKG